MARTRFVDVHGAGGISRTISGVSIKMTLSINIKLWDTLLTLITIMALARLDGRRSFYVYAFVLI